MTTLEQFRAADKRVDEIEANGGLYEGEGYSGGQSTNEYDEALAESQRLYQELEAQGIDPFQA